MDDQIDLIDFVAAVLAMRVDPAPYTPEAHANGLQPANRVTVANTPAMFQWSGTANGVEARTMVTDPELDLYVRADWFTGPEPYRLVSARTSLVSASGVVYVMALGVR